MTLAAVSESVYYQIPISGYGDVDYHATLTQVQEVKAFIFNEIHRYRTKNISSKIVHYNIYLGELFEREGRRGSMFAMSYHKTGTKKC